MVIRQFKCRFEGMLLMGMAFLLLILAPFNGIMAKSSENG
jgi:hypothetical protein